MGWPSCLPAICMSNRASRISHRTSRLFEEKQFSDTPVQSVSVFEYYGNRKRKSSEKIPLFMCDYCDYNCESKSNVFEHFIKNHVFLCTLCSFAALSRSCVLKHCLVSHERAVEDKLKCMKAYSLDVDLLLTELGASKNGFDEDLYNLPKSSHLLYNSDDDISNHSFLAKSSKETKSNMFSSMLSSDMDSDPENEEENNGSIQSDGNNSDSSIVHFLDQSVPHGSRKSQRFEDDYNELSDSNQMELFFSNEGNENDADLSESIFHDHKEMFMVSRLPFPIRQDDSPNDPLMNDVNPSSEPILQTILQKDKFDPVVGPSSSGMRISSKKNCEAKDVQQSISPSLSIPSGETLQKQLEAVIPKSSAFNNTDNDTELQNLEKGKELKSSLDDMFHLSKNVAAVEHILGIKKEYNNVGTSSQNEKDELDNFLISPGAKYRTRTEHNEEDCETVLLEKNTSDIKEDEFGLLHNLLNDEHISNSQTNDREIKTETSAAIEVTSKNILEKETSVTVRSASNMSLLELLSKDTAFPLLRTSASKSNNGSIDIPNNQHASAALVCKSCDKTFVKRDAWDCHVKLCKRDKPIYPLVRSKIPHKTLPGTSPDKLVSLPSHHLKSSLVTDEFTASKILSKFSEYHMNAGFNNNTLPDNSNTKSNKLSKVRSKRPHAGPISRFGVKHRKLKMQNSTASRSKAKNRNQMQNETKSLNVNDSSLGTQKKRKLEQDDDYYPESESSENSDNMTIDSFKPRKKASRNKKHSFCIKKKSTIKRPATVNVKSQFSAEALNDEPLNPASENSSLSSSISSSLSSSLSSSFQVSTLKTSSTRGKNENLLPTSSQFSKSEERKAPERMNASATEMGCSLQSIKVESLESSSQLLLATEIKQEIEGQDKFQLSQTCVSGVYFDPTISKCQDAQLRDSSQTLLHHLLSDVPIGQNRIGTKHQSSINTPSQDNTVKPNSEIVEASCTKRSSSNSYSEGTSLESVQKEKSEFINSPITYFNENEKQNGSILNYILGGSSKSGSLLRTRSYSVPEFDSIQKHKVCKDMKNPSLSFSASMMDIPDPPIVPSPSTDRAHLMPALSAMLSMSSNKSQFYSNNKSSPKSLSVSQTTSTSSSKAQPPDLQASATTPSGGTQSCIVSSANADSLKTSESSSSSLLRNLLTQPSKTKANSK